MIFDIEKTLLDLAQTNIIMKNIGEHKFQLMTLTSTIREELELEEELDCLLDRAADYGLSIKGERAVDFDGMNDQKLTLFWSNKAFSVNDDEVSVRKQFGALVLEESEMEDLIEKLTPEDDEEISTESLLEDAVSYSPN